MLKWDKKKEEKEKKRNKIKNQFKLTNMEK